MDQNPPPQYQQPPPPGVYNTAHSQSGYPAPPAYPGAAYGQYPGHPGQPGNVVVVTQPGIRINTGNCPSCGIGYLRTEYSPLGLILCLLFFPLGLICCIMMAQKRCTHCRASFPA